MTNEQRTELVAAISDYLYISEDVLAAPDDAAENILRMVERAMGVPPGDAGKATPDTPHPALRQFAEWAFERYCLDRIYGWHGQRLYGLEVTVPETMLQDFLAYQARRGVPPGGAETGHGGVP
jgi:hypothetical protein